MAGPAIRVEGAKRLRDTLRAAGADMADLRAVHAEVARMVVPIIASRAPRRTGRLASTVRGSGTKTGAVTRTGSSRVPYARPIHWGWPARHIAPNRFAWDVVEALREEIVDKYEDEADRVLDTVKGA